MNLYIKYLNTPISWSKKTYLHGDFTCKHKNNIHNSVIVFMIKQFYKLNTYGTTRCKATEKCVWQKQKLC